MRVVVVGATGNAGTSLLTALAGEASVDSVLGIARRRPSISFPKTQWAVADIARDDLVTHFRGADAVVHLAWLVQPSHDLGMLWRTNVDGSARVFAAVRDAGVPVLVYASSIGAYSPGPKERAVDESWPTDGVPSNEYARQKAEVERRLDRFEAETAGVRVVRLRPALIFKRESASEQRRIFAGPFLPSPLLRRGFVPVLPDIRGLRFQAVHSYDVGDAYRLAVVRDVRGAFNVAAEPVLDMKAVARLLRARLVPMPARALRAAAAASWRLHVTPIPASWLDMALAVPIMDTRRARDELGWEPRHSAERALAELFEGIRDGAGLETPPLSPRTSGRFRVQELKTGVGEEP